MTDNIWGPSAPREPSDHVPLNGADAEPSKTPDHAPSEIPAPGRDDRGRFKTGCTGNPRGRPRRRERTYTKRQIILDQISISERLVPITIDGRKQYYPAIVALYWKRMQLALNGDKQMLKTSIDEYETAIEEIRRLNPDYFEGLEEHERRFAEVDPLSLDKSTISILNGIRGQSRKI